MVMASDCSDAYSRTGTARTSFSFSPSETFRFCGSASLTPIIARSFVSFWSRSFVA